MRINRQRKSKIPNTNCGKLLHRTSTSYKMLLSIVTFRIQTLAKSWTARGASHQPAFMDSCLIIGHTRLASLPRRWVSTGCSIKSYWTESHMDLSSISGGRVTLQGYVECLWMIGLMVVMLMFFFQLQ